MEPGFGKQKITVDITDFGGGEYRVTLNPKGDHTITADVFEDYKARTRQYLKMQKFLKEVKSHHTEEECGFYLRRSYDGICAIHSVV